MARFGDDSSVIFPRQGLVAFPPIKVRNIAGTLKLVGLERWHPDDVARALAARDRRAGGPTAPPEGLYLVEIRYPSR